MESCFPISILPGAFKLPAATVAFRAVPGKEAFAVSLTPTIASLDF